MGNVMMEASQINYRGGVTKMSVEQALKETSGEAAAIAALQAAVGNLQTGKADLPVIAPEFDAETGVYAVGDLVMYQGKLYEFTTAHETAGDWNSTEVTEKTVSDEIDSLKSGLTNVNSNLSSKQNATDNNLQTTDKTVVGAINEVKSGLIGEVVSITTGVTLYKQGKFRMLVVYGAKSTRDGIIAIIPASDKPASQFIYPSMFVENNTTKAGSLQINANGNVHIRSYDDVLKDNCPVYGSYCYYII